MRVVQAIQGCLKREKVEVITGILVMTRVSGSQPVPGNTCMQHPSRSVRKDIIRITNSRSEKRVLSQPVCPSTYMGWVPILWRVASEIQGCVAHVALIFEVRVIEHDGVCGVIH